MTIDWSNQLVIGVVVSLILLGVAGYLWWAYSKKSWPFNN